MEEHGFIKDDTEYLVFACTKCNQYSYVKSSQKTKKCLRCGRTYHVKNLMASSILVKGVSAAVKKVKEFQNQLEQPEFQTNNEFTISVKSPIKSYSAPIFDENKSGEDEIGHYRVQFLKALKELSLKYKLFPFYMINLIAEEHQIPVSLVFELTRGLLEKKILVKNDNNLYFLP